MELDEMAPLNTDRSEEADGTSDPEDEDAEQLLQVSNGIDRGISVYFSRYLNLSRLWI